MKRHVHASQRTVTVEDGTVRDLDGNELGEVKPRHEVAGGTRLPIWAFRPHGQQDWFGNYVLQRSAVADLVSHPSCPAGGPNLYDREGTR